MRFIDQAKLSQSQESVSVQVLNPDGENVLHNVEVRDSAFPFAFLHLIPKMEEVYRMEVKKGDQTMTVLLDLYFVGTRKIELETVFQEGKYCFRLLDLSIEQRHETIKLNKYFLKKCPCKKKFKSIN